MKKILTLIIILLAFISKAQNLPFNRIQLASGSGSVVVTNSLGVLTYTSTLPTSAIPTLTNYVPTSSLTSLWSINGNSLGNNTSFIGPIDARSLYIKTNNTQRIKIDSLGQTIIGTVAPNTSTLGNVLRVGKNTTWIDMGEWQTGYFGTWYGSTPSATNWQTTYDGNKFYLNGPTGVTIRANQVDKLDVNSGGITVTGSISATSAVTSPTIYGSSAAGGTLNLKGSPTGTNDIVSSENAFQTRVSNLNATGSANVNGYLNMGTSTSAPYIQWAGAAGTTPSGYLWQTGIDVANLPYNSDFVLVDKVKADGSVQDLIYIKYNGTNQPVVSIPASVTNTNSTLLLTVDGSTTSNTYNTLRIGMPTLQTGKGILVTDASNNDLFSVNVNGDIMSRSSITTPTAYITGGTLAVITNTTDAVLITNTTAATSSVPKSSPFLYMSGRTWNSSLGNVITKGGLQMNSHNFTGGGSNPALAKLSFLVGSDNATPTEKGYFTSDGNFVTLGGVNVSAPTASTSNIVFNTTSVANSGTAYGSNKLVLKGSAWNSAQGAYPSIGYMQLLNVTNNASPTIEKLSFFVGGANTSNSNINATGSATEYFSITSNGNVSVGTTTLATTATDGFFYIPTCAGVPTGVPTTLTGRAPIVIDATNNKMYIYSGGAWVALN